MTFWMLAAVFAAVAITLLATSLYRDVNPRLPHPLWALLPLVCSAGFTWLAANLTRHAYLILTPIGIEIFPFFRPAAGMRLILWQEVLATDVNNDNTLLTLHHDAAKTSGIHLTLRPIRKGGRALLVKAVSERAK
ncbi:MAG: hypothetical protein H8M99_07850 [Gloeobacteraceae cyanobacterium ES-bin-144]|nr:hypothetical protein [Verrucomicrobiales bacterium]